MTQVTSSQANYRELRLELSGLLTEDWLSNLANFSASLFAKLHDLNWVGFYLVRTQSGPSHLKLGPFQGRPACLDIPFDRGVCGRAAQDQATMIVADVHQFPGHISCDERSRSEIVVPLVANRKVIGVLDLDSPSIGRFTEEDALGLEDLVSLLMEKTKWPKDI